MARILFVLRRVHSGIVCNADDHTAVYARVRNSKQRVGGHVKSHVFHSASRPCARKARAERRFSRHLFVGRPLGVQAVVFC